MERKLTYDLASPAAAVADCCFCLFWCSPSTLLFVALRADERPGEAMSPTWGSCVPELGKLCPRAGEEDWGSRVPDLGKLRPRAGEAVSPT